MQLVSDSCVVQCAGSYMSVCRMWGVCGICGAARFELSSKVAHAILNKQAGNRTVAREAARRRAGA